MTVYVYRPKHPDADERGMVPLSVANADERRNRSPNVISDSMDPLKHMGTGQIIDSKSRFRQATKASGCIEIGNEIQTTPRAPVKLDKGERKNAIRRALWELRNSR